MRKRHCNIKATNLKDLLAALNRNISNTIMTKADMLMEGDLTETDAYYCDMLLGILMDLEEDLKEIIKKSFKETNASLQESSEATNAKEKEI